MKNMIKSMLKFDENERISWDEIRKLPIVQDHINKKNNNNNNNNNEKTFFLSRSISFITYSIKTQD